MTRREALQIPDLQIEPNGLVEDCFYYFMAKAGRLSLEQGLLACQHLKGSENDPCYIGALILAKMMIRNLDSYGVACAAWCE